MLLQEFSFSSGLTGFIFRQRAQISTSHRSAVWWYNVFNAIFEGNIHMYGRQNK